MGNSNSSFDSRGYKQEAAVNSYYNSNKSDLSCGGKYNERQIKGKLRDEYNNSNSYSRNNNYVTSFDASYKSNNSYQKASNYFRNN